MYKLFHMGREKKRLHKQYMPEKCNSKYQVLQYLMLTSLFIQKFLILVQPQMEVFDPSSSSKFGWLVIKCPYSKQGDTLDQASSDPGFILKKSELIFFFKKTHFYYAQVQGKLALTGLPWSDP